jgi:hypothetical protein
MCESKLGSLNPYSETKMCEFTPEPTNITFLNADYPMDFFSI